MANIRCIVFSRVSSLQQDLEGQIKEVMKNALKDYAKDEIIVVEGKESASQLEEDQRQTLNEMKQLIEKYPTIESVYCFAIDRIARRVSVALSVKDYPNKL
jgi:DNA invertase Pin-like site-specific DNA recombinase